MRRRLSYFEKRLLLREESFLLGKETSIKRRKSYFENRLVFKEKSLLKRDSIKRKVLF